MKKYFVALFSILLIGLFTISCSSPGVIKNTGAKTEISAAQGAITDSMTPNIQAAANPVMAPVNESAGEIPDKAPINWFDDHFWGFISGLIYLIYEFLATKIPTSKTVTIIGNLYKLLTYFFPDKTKEGTKFGIECGKKVLTDVLK
jgi:hypothetical protein